MGSNTELWERALNITHQFIDVTREIQAEVSNEEAREVLGDYAAGTMERLLNVLQSLSSAYEAQVVASKGKRPVKPVYSRYAVPSNGRNNKPI